MQLSETWDQIGRERIRELVQQYPSTVPSKLEALEKLRLREVPDILQTRKEDGKAYLTKKELLGLVEWKLKHGTFRPSLMKLVSSNSDDLIQANTAEAFAACDAEDFSEAVTVLTRLSGVGPATASLIGSEYDSVRVPFFSDELFRFLHLETDGKGGIRGWDRKIGYKPKEYNAICERVALMRTRLNGQKGTEDLVGALDVEKAAYVLARLQNDPSAMVPPEKQTQKRAHETVASSKEQTIDEAVEERGSKQRHNVRKRTKLTQ